jgi:5-methylcytosine-specific restriction protein A
MAFLRNLKPRVGGLPQRLQWADAHGHVEASPARRLYKTAAWQQLRRRVFERDNYTCQWAGCGLVLRRPHADHKIPPRGDRALFFAEANVWTLCPPHHNSAKQREEREQRQAGGYPQT